MAGCQSDGTTDIVSSGSDSPVSSKQWPGRCGLGEDPLFNPLNEDRFIPDLIDVATGVVTPDSGGTLVISQSSVVIPAGAVTGNVMVAWAMLDRTPPDLPDALPRTYIFAPHGINFLVPIKVYISFDDAGLGQGTPFWTKFYCFNESTGVWEEQETRYNLFSKQFIVTLNHFSRYAFGRAA